MWAASILPDSVWWSVGCVLGPLWVSPHSRGWHGHYWPVQPQQTVSFQVCFPSVLVFNKIHQMSLCSPVLNYLCLCSDPKMLGDQRQMWLPTLSTVVFLDVEWSRILPASRGDCKTWSGISFFLKPLTQNMQSLQKDPRFGRGFLQA